MVHVARSFTEAITRCRSEPSSCAAHLLRAAKAAHLAPRFELLHELQRLGLSLRALLGLHGAPHEVCSTAVGAASSTHDACERQAEEAGAFVLACLTLETLETLQTLGTLEVLAVHPVEQALSERCSQSSSAPRAHPAPARRPAGQAPLWPCGTPRCGVHAGPSVLRALLHAAPAVNRRSGHVCCVKCASGCCAYLQTPGSAGVACAARAQAYRQPARYVWRPDKVAHSRP